VLAALLPIPGQYPTPSFFAFFFSFLLFNYIFLFFSFLFLFFSFSFSFHSVFLCIFIFLSFYLISYFFSLSFLILQSTLILNRFDKTNRSRRYYYHNVAYKSSDVDVFIYGLNQEQANKKVRSIFPFLLFSVCLFDNEEIIAQLQLVIPFLLFIFLFFYFIFLYLKVGIIIIIIFSSRNYILSSPTTCTWMQLHFAANMLSPSFLSSLFAISRLYFDFTR
jgi:hypothetical protein